MKEIYVIDVVGIDRFSRGSYDYVCVECDGDWMLWRMTRKGVVIPMYELWKRKDVKNPDGSVVWCKPSDEDFGRYAWYITGSEVYCMDKIVKIKMGK